MEESALISKTEKFLNEIYEEEIDLDNIEDFDNFKEFYFKLDDRLSQLQKLRETMDAQGYTSPFRSLNKYGVGTVGEVSVDELSETSKHNQFFRTKANAKKNILDRVKSAIDSHKIAIGNLEQYGHIKCENCYKKYRINEYKENDGNCTCGSEKFSFKINKDNCYRLEIIPYLPLSGNYRVSMNNFGKYGREAFKKVINVLKQERKGVVKTISVVAKIKDENGRWIRKKINFGAEDADNYEEELRKIYGKNVRIEVLRFHRTKTSIIQDKYTRTALAIAYVRFAEDLIEEIKDPLFKRKIADFKRLNKYDEIVERINSTTPNFIDKNAMEDLEDWRSSEIIKECQELGYMDKFGNLNRSLKRDLKIRENIEKIIFINIASTMIKWDIFRYYLTTSYNRRKITNGPFPHLATELDRQQRKIFQNNYNKVIDTLNKFNNLKILSIPDMDFILYEKFNIEKLIKNSNMKLNYPALGVGLIHLNSNIDVKTLGNVFNVNESKVNKEIKNIKKIKKPKSSKSKQFLEMIKK